MKCINKLTRVIFITIILLVLPEAISIQAQAFSRIYQGGYITELLWSANGELLTFFNGLSPRLVSSGNESWYEYDPETDNLTQETQWSLQPNLSTEEIDLYRPVRLNFTVDGVPATYDSFIFSSPDDEYIVYASESGANERGIPVLVADLSTQTVVETYTRAWTPTDGSYSFNVIWNQTGTAFVVTALPNESGGFGPLVQAHVSNFATTLTDIETTPVEIVIDNVNYTPANVYSISDDERYVLLSAYDFLSR